MQSPCIYKLVEIPLSAWGLSCQHSWCIFLGWVLILILGMLHSWNGEGRAACACVNIAMTCTIYTIYVQNTLSVNKHSNFLSSLSLGPSEAVPQWDHGDYGGQGYGWWGLAQPFYSTYWGYKWSKHSTLITDGQNRTIKTQWLLWWVQDQELKRS